MPEPLRLDLDVLLPDAPDARDACVTRLTDELAATPGVARAHVLPADEAHPDRLCLHYDPATVALPRLRRTAERAGAHLTQRYGHVVWPVDGLGHQRRARTVATRLARRPGVVEAEANATGPIRIEFDREATSEADLRHALGDLGVTVTADGAHDPTAHDGHDHTEPGHDDHAEDDHVGHDHGPGGHAHDHGGIFGE